MKLGHSQAEIAEKYYSIVHPERNYTREQAKKAFHQDANIDGKILQRVVTDRFREMCKYIRKTY